MSETHSRTSGIAMSGARSVVAAAVAAIAGAKPEFASDGEVRDGSTVDLPQQAIFYANHSSHLDFVTLWASLPPRLRNRVRPVAAADYWSSGLRRAAAEGFFNAYLVERGGTNAGRGARDNEGVANREAQGTDRAGRSSSQIDGMNAVLAAGDSLIIFPEGTRGTGEHLARFQSGLYHLARRNPDIPVIPVALGNLGRILPKGEKIPVPHLSTVRFHDPIRVDEGESKEGFLARATEIIIRSLRSFDPDAGDEPEPGVDAGEDSRKEER